MAFVQEKDMLVVFSESGADRVASVQEAEWPVVAIAGAAEWSVVAIAGAAEWTTRPLRD